MLPEKDNGSGFGGFPRPIWQPFIGDPLAVMHGVRLTPRDGHRNDAL
jgi:hypothetical protein